MHYNENKLDHVEIAGDVMMPLVKGTDGLSWS